MRVAVLGCGMIAREHLRAIKRYRGAQVVGLADPDLRALNQAGEEFGVSERFSDAAALLQETRPDVVHVATPPSTHLQMAMLALQAGAHVYVEKPIALNLPEAEELVAFAQRTNLKLCVGYNHLFDRAMLRARQLVEQGVIGSICGIESYRGMDRGRDNRFFRQAYSHWVYGLPGAILQNDLDHPLSVILPLIRQPKTVMAVAAATGVLPRGVPDELRILLGDEPPLASITLSQAASPGFHYVNLHGTLGTLQVDLLNQRVIPFRHLPGVPAFMTRAAMNAGQGARVLTGTTATILKLVLTRFGGHLR